MSESKRKSPCANDRPLLVEIVEGNRVKTIEDCDKRREKKKRIEGELKKDGIWDTGSGRRKGL